MRHSVMASACSPQCWNGCSKESATRAAARRQMRSAPCRAGSSSRWVLLPSASLIPIDFPAFDSLLARFWRHMEDLSAIDLIKSSTIAIKRIHGIAGVPPLGPFSAAPAVPVSESSPFTELGNAPTYDVSNASEYSTYWRCGDSVMNTVVYHSLSLSVENGLCINNTLLDGTYDCSGTPINQATYTALVTGEASCVRLLFICLSHSQYFACSVAVFCSQIVWSYRKL